MEPPIDFLDTFDHVVVLMMENRSFDNILGHLYDGCLPAGKRFEGAAGQWNPDYAGRGRIETSLTSNYHTPYPDPGEDFEHVIRQLYSTSYGSIDRNADPPMNGFILDYYHTLLDLTRIHGKCRFPWPFDPAWYSPGVMKCFRASAIPALSKLARDFAVFDHWFAALPSETWTNRAFWHAATSWGWVDNPAGLESSDPWNLFKWLEASSTGTLFSLLDERFPAEKNNWRVYEDLVIAATKLIHYGNLKDKKGPDHFRYLEYDDGTHSNFFKDCASGDLPKYAFLEPHLVNFVSRGMWHNDMHPSEWVKSPLWAFLTDGGPGSVLLGDQLIWQVYEAIRASTLRDRTLLIITFDEHGGCFDHVHPPKATPPDGRVGQYGFDFTRLGPRVPMVMISSRIAQNTIVNAPMHHCSFLKTMQEKWSLGSLGPRQDDAPSFAKAVFSPQTRSWPDLSGIYRDHPALRKTKTKRPPNLGNRPVRALQSSIFEAMRTVLAAEGFASTFPKVVTHADAQRVLDRSAEFTQFGRGY